MPIPIGVVPAALQVGYGLYQDIAGNSALDNLPNPKTYETGEAINDRAQSQAKGFDNSELSAFYRRMLLGDNRTYQRIKSINPTQAGAIQGALTANDLNSEVQLAAKNAQIKRENARYLAGIIGTQSNLNTKSFNDNLAREQQAYGAASKTGVENIFGGINSATNTISNNNFWSQLMGMKTAAPGTTAGTGTAAPATGGMTPEQIAYLKLLMSSSKTNTPATPEYY